MIMFQTILNTYDVFCDIEKINKSYVTKTGEFNNVKYDYLDYGDKQSIKSIYSTDPYDYLMFLNRH